MSSVSADNPNLKNNYPNSGNNSAEAKTASAPALLDDKAKLEKSITRTPNMEQVNNPDANNQLHSADDIVAFYTKNKPSWQKVAKAASELLKKSDSEIPILPQTLDGTMGDFRKTVVEDYKKARKIILKALDKSNDIQDFVKLVFSLDGDGNVFNKTLLKTQNSDSSGSLTDKLALRMLVWVVHQLGGEVAINSQRVSITANMSVQGSEGEDIFHNGEIHPSYRTPSRISDCFDELGIYGPKDPLFNLIQMIGLGSAVMHEPGKVLKLNDKVIKFSEIVDAMNQHHGFLDKFNEIIKEKGLRVLEYKALPEYLTGTKGESKLEDYLRFTDLTEKALKAKWSDQKYAQAFKNLNIPLSEKHKTLLKELEDPNNTDINTKTFSAALRYGKIVCMVPHAIDPHNVLDETSKLKLIKLIVKTLRSPEIKDFLAKKYNFAKDKDIFNINNISAEHIDFSGDNPKNTLSGEVYTDFNRLADSLEDDQKAQKTTVASEEQALKIIANTPNPYLEFTTATNKEDVLPGIAECKANNMFQIGGGDSPSDKTLMAHTLLTGGAAFIARGQIEEERDLADGLISLLLKDKYAEHEFALEEIAPQKYKFIHSGEEIDDKSLRKKLISHFEDNIVRNRNVPLNSSMFGGVMLELAQALNIKGLDKVVGIKDPNKFSLDVNMDAPWVKEFLNNKKDKADISTPLLPGLWEDVKQENIDKGGNKIPFSERGDLQKLISKIPGFGPLISMEKPGPAFQKLFTIVMGGLFAGGLVGMTGVLGGNKGAEKAGVGIQRWAYRLQTLAAGTSFYLMTAHKFTLKSIGEGFGLLSTLFPKGSPLEGILRPLCEINMAGLANQGEVKNSLNIDAYLDAKDPNPASKAAFKNPDKFYNIRVAATEHNEARKEGIRYFQREFMGGALSKLGGVGEFIAHVVPDIQMWLTMTKEFFTEPGLRKGVIKNLMPSGNHGIGARMGKNNGMPYTAPHSEPHLLAATASLTAGSALASLAANKAKVHWLGNIFESIANVLPSLGLINHAKTAALNIGGEQTRFTDRHGQQRTFSPQKAAKWQLAGSYLMALGGAGRGLTDENTITHKLHMLSGFIQNIGLGFLVKGLAEEFVPEVDNNEIVQAQHNGRYVAGQDFNKLDSKQVSLVKRIGGGDKTPEMAPA